MDYIIRKLFYGGGTRRLKKYFHVVYGGGRRTYGGAGRNSHVRKLKGFRQLLLAPNTFEPAPNTILKFQKYPLFWK